MPINEQKRQPTRIGKAVLELRPGGRSVFTVFLRIQGNGGPFRHLSRGVLHGSPTMASIDFKCVSYNDLATDRAVLGKSVAARKEFTLVVNV